MEVRSKRDRNPRVLRLAVHWYILFLWKPHLQSSFPYPLIMIGSQK